MSVEFKNAKVTKVDPESIGGATYWVKIAGSDNHKGPICFRKMKNQPHLRCTHPAGYTTDHPGTGACKYHGGAKKRPTISTGVYAVQTKKRLKSKIDDYMLKSRDELLDLTEHLAAARVIFDEFLDAFPDTSSEEYGLWFMRFNTLLITISNLVDKVSRIDSRNTLTAAQVLYLRATMIDILMKYVPEPDMRERVVKELAARMGGDLEIEMKPSEVSLNARFIDSDYVEEQV
jgi:hypothetical protein